MLLRSVKPEDYPPAYQTGAGIWRDVAEEARPVEKLTVSAAAEKFVRLHGSPFSFERTPYMREPADALGSGKYRRVVIVGPAQSGKSTAADLWFAWTATVSPANMLWLQADKSTMRDYVTSHINPIVTESPLVKRRLLPGLSSDNTFNKQFIGFQAWFAWPVKAQLRMRTAPRWVADDFDAIPEDIEGEGSPIALLESRQTSDETGSVGAIVSSPALGPDKGIEYEWGQGTRKALHWPCPHCHEYFEANFADQANFKNDGTPEEAQVSVTLVCPHCDLDIEPKWKGWMKDRYRFPGANQEATPEGEIVGPEIESSTDSYWIDGAAGLASWGELARRVRAAQIVFETRQDEADLQTVYNTGLGRNYRFKLQGAKPLEAEDLARRQTGYSLGEVPDGVRVLVAAIDVQGNRFEVLVAGVGDGLECWVVDRFAIGYLDDGRTKIQPATHPEHWAVLLPKVIWRTYAKADGTALPILSTAIDTGGEDGVTENAYGFWHQVKKLVSHHRQRLTLIKGQPRGELLRQNLIERTPRGAKLKGGVDLFEPNVNRFKSILDHRLRREDPGPAAIHLPDDFSAEHRDEIVAEEKDGKGNWGKRQGKTRNETLDLLVYVQAALSRFAQKKTDLSWLPAWYRAGEDQTNGVRQDAGGTPAPPGADRQDAGGTPAPPGPTLPPADQDKAAALKALLHRSSDAGTIED